MVDSAWEHAQKLLLEDEVGEGVRKIAISVPSHTCHKRQYPLSPPELADYSIGHLQVILFHRLLFLILIWDI